MFIIIEPISVTIGCVTYFGNLYVPFIYCLKEGFVGKRKILKIANPLTKHRKRNS